MELSVRFTHQKMDTQIQQAQRMPWLKVLEIMGPKYTEKIE